MDPRAHHDAETRRGLPVRGADADATATGPVPSRRPGGVTEVAAVFTRLGLLSFGGPVAHLGYFRAELVQRRRWVDDARYGDLVALCQFLPGPASSQVVFALGKERAGLAGALAASACFTLPSAVLMVAFACGVAAVGDLAGSGWLHGLKLAAVAVVAQAVLGMGRSLCPDRTRVGVALAAAALLTAVPGALTQLAAIALGGLVGWTVYRRSETLSVPPAEAPLPGRHTGSLLALAAFAALLVVLPALAATTGDATLRQVDAFYRAGSLVFGGGHVVLPLLRAEVVPRGWLADDRFLAGYGAAQAVPGPLFTFSAYLGAAMHPGPWAWLHGLGGLVAIFLPAWLLVGGALPFWHRLRARRTVRAALAGANAAVVGVLLAALHRPVAVEGVHGVADAVAAIVAFALLLRRVPPWLVVVAAAAAGQWVLPA